MVGVGCKDSSIGPTTVPRLFSVLAVSQHQPKTISSTYCSLSHLVHYVDNSYFIPVIVRKDE